MKKKSKWKQVAGSFVQFFQFFCSFVLKLVKLFHIWLNLLGLIYEISNMGKFYLFIFNALDYSL